MYGPIETGNYPNLNGDAFKPLISHKTELSTELGIIMWGYRVVIQKKIIKVMFLKVSAYPISVLSRPNRLSDRMYVWWPR